MHVDNIGSLQTATFEQIVGQSAEVIQQVVLSLLRKRVPPTT